MFYAQTDWLRLATKLAQQPSPCAQYYVSVPPLAADKSQPRPNQAGQIRALGPSYHALDEISWNGWSAWVAAGNGSWYDAGVTARQRMAAAGFDTGTGDTWALNELSSAVRAGTGVARANALEFMRGLASDGLKGVVFVAGVGQGTPDLATYKVNLQHWLEDSAFWSAAGRYAADWAQEDYGDVRAYAVADASPQARRDAQAQYLGHELALAAAGPDTTAAARSVLQSAYVAFGNAAWAWSSAYGWTAAPLASMQDFVSGQVDAARSLGAPSGVDRLGFAWVPSNTLGLSAGDFDAQTSALLDRIAGAIQASGVPADDPGAAACAPSWCTTSLDGAAFVAGWQGFSAWSATAPVFVSAPLSLQQGLAGGPLTVQLQTDGLADAAATARDVTFTSSSSGGAFASAAAGPWSPSLAATVPAGTSTVSVYYLDTQAGSPAVTASGAGGSAAQVQTVAAAVSPPPVAPPPAPPPATPPPAPVQRKPPPRPRVASVRTRLDRGHVAVRVVVTTRSRGVHVLIRVRRGARTIAVVTRVTAAHGVATWRSAHRVRPGRYAATAAVRSASTA